jgi:LPXTG-site transpeptidase (sortase) family protein
MWKVMILIARIIQASQRAYLKKWMYLGVFAFIFLGSTIVLGRLGLLPETVPAIVAKESKTNTNRQTVQPEKPVITELPIKIEITKIGISTIVTNPSTTDITALDNELLKGAVHYPTSAKLGEIGNVVLFGHSSYLPIVKNQAYKAFNDIQKLSAGDEITIYSSDMVHTYKVRTVADEKADNNTAIPLSVTEKTLTLVTCNSFGKEEDRFVVTADFVESHLISSQN